MEEEEVEEVLIHDYKLHSWYVVRGGSGRGGTREEMILLVCVVIPHVDEG